MLAGGLLVGAVAVGVEAAMTVAKYRSLTTAVAAAAPKTVAALPPLTGPALTGVELHPAHTANMQCFVQLPQTGEWFTTQAAPGTGGLVDPAGLAVGDIVVSRLAPDGTLLDSMTLPDSGHGMGLVVRIEGGARVLYTCWFASGASGSLYDVVRIPYAPGVANRASAATIVAGVGYPLDSSYEASTNAVTLRHQGGGGPEYTRHRWADFVAGDVSRPTGRDRHHRPAAHPPGLRQPGRPVLLLHGRGEHGGGW